MALGHAAQPNIAKQVHPSHDLARKQLVLTTSKLLVTTKIIPSLLSIFFNDATFNFRLKSLENFSVFEAKTGWRSKVLWPVITRLHSSILVLLI